MIKPIRICLMLLVSGYLPSQFAQAAQEDIIGGIGGTGEQEEIIGGIGGTGIRDMERPELLERPEILDRDSLDEAIDAASDGIDIMDQDQLPNTDDLPDEP